MAITVGQIVNHNLNDVVLSARGLKGLSVGEVGRQGGNFADLVEPDEVGHFRYGGSLGLEGSVGHASDSGVDFSDVVRAGRA